MASKKKICSYCSYIPDKSTKVNIFPYVVSNHINTKSRVISPVSTDKKEKKEKKETEIFDHLKVSLTCLTLQAALDTASFFK